MKKNILQIGLMITILLISIIFNSGFTIADDVHNQVYTPGQVVVLVGESGDSDFKVESKLRELSEVGLNSIDKFHNYELFDSLKPHGPRMFTLNFDENINPDLIVNFLKKDDSVLIAEPNYIVPLSYIPNDLYFTFQWNLEKIEMPNAWNLEKGSEDVIISVIDTGADLDHEDLIGRLLPGWDVVDNDAIPEDDHGHGTAVTGMIGATMDNWNGIAGICSECSILPVRAAYNSGGVPTISAAKAFRAMEYSVNNPRGLEGLPENLNIADVISMSAAFEYPSTFLLWGVQDSYAEGAILVTSAGNDNSNSPTYPGAYAEVITVGATDENDEKAYFSNYGNWIDVVAPGVNIFTLTRGNSYTSFSGTCAATPQVSGLIGLMLSIDPELSQEEVRQILIDTSDPVIGFESILGGRINAFNALDFFSEPIKPGFNGGKEKYIMYNPNDGNQN